MDISELIDQAGQGSTVAQGLLGIAYLDGVDVPPDYEEAMKWLTLAADKGAPRPMWNLGRMYEEGLSTTIDLEKARQLYERAAAGGEFYAFIHLARLYRDGKGVPQSDRQARSWYCKATEMKERVADVPELREALDFVEASDSP